MSQDWSTSLPVRLLPTVLATGLGSSLLYYFGWVSEREKLRRFGVSTALVDHSSTYYVINSLGVVVHPAKLAVVLVLVAVGCLWLLSLASDRLGPRSQILWVAVIGTGALFMVVFDRVMFGRLAYRLAIRGDVAATVWTFGALLTLFATIQLWPVQARVLPQPWYVTTVRQSSPTSTRLGTAARVVVMGALGVLVTVGLFLIAAQAGVRQGTREAERTIERQDQLRDLVVTSRSRLPLDGHPGVSFREVTSMESAGSFEYSGLKFLLRTDSKIVFFPAQLVLGEAPIQLLSTDEVIQLEVSRPADDD